MANDVSDYQQEQLKALEMARSFLSALPQAEYSYLEELVGPYLQFREEAQLFLSSNFSGICSKTCYESQLSACCSKEGIITFFADVVINVLYSSIEEHDLLQQRLKQPNPGFKCIYLGHAGCLWKIKPIVCQMFLCPDAEKKAFSCNPAAGEAWESLKRKRMMFTWPDRPVLFDLIENYFITAGLSSSLMYLHQSPGLLRVKRKAGLLVSS
jgi:hypothetical protein